MQKKRNSSPIIGRFAEVLYGLPSELKTRIKMQVAEEFVAAGRQRELSLLFPDDSDLSSDHKRPKRCGPVEYAASHYRKRKIAFGWYGGKFNHLGWLLPLLPQTHHYCEPFGGSAAVLLNRDPSPVETFNDIDG